VREIFAISFLPLHPYYHPFQCIQIQNHRKLTSSNHSSSSIKIPLSDRVVNGIFFQLISINCKLSYSFLCAIASLLYVLINIWKYMNCRLLFICILETYHQYIFTMHIQCVIQFVHVARIRQNKALLCPHVQKSTCG